MTFTGARSCIVNIANSTSGNFTIQIPSLISGNWISGEEPIHGDQLVSNTVMRWGLETQNASEGVSGSVLLIGYGNPIDISWALDVHNVRMHNTLHSNKVNATYDWAWTGSPEHQTLEIVLHP